MNKNNKDIEETLDIKRENYKLRKENFELLQDNAKLQEEINRLNYKLKEKICFEGHSQFKELRKELETYKKMFEEIVEGYMNEFTGCNDVKEFTEYLRKKVQK
jgi:hypothetical protein